MLKIIVYWCAFAVACVGGYIAGRGRLNGDRRQHAMGWLTVALAMLVAFQYGCASAPAVPAKIIYRDSVVTRMVIRDSLVPNIIQRDSLVTRIIARDSVVVTIIPRDSIVPRIWFRDSVVTRVVVRDSTVTRIVPIDSIVRHTVFVADTVHVRVGQTYQLMHGDTLVIPVRADSAP